MRYTLSPWLTIAAILFLAPAPCAHALSNSSDSLSFQGFITDDSGVPVNDPSVSILFKIYKDGVPVWEETHAGVEVTNGIFNVLLGVTTSLDTLAFDGPLELGITVEADSEISPRTPLVAAAFAKALPGMYTYYRDDGFDEGYNVVGGASLNVVANDVAGATIAGGGGFFLNNARPNSVLDHWGAIGGGLNNTASGYSSTVGGGSTNSASGPRSTVGGGSVNTADNESATVAGGSNHTATGEYSTIGGGRQSEAGGDYATIAGGYINLADGDRATVGGGGSNIVTGSHATVPGGHVNAARGAFSFAAGRSAKANHDNTFVWNATSNGIDSLASTTTDQFLARASNGFTFYTNAAMTTGAVLAANTGSWGSVSDVNSKTGFGRPDPSEVLERLMAVPVQTWRYKGQDETITHMGPTAQDFYEAFGLGIDERHIVTVDADGVSFAAIQGLYELVMEQRKEIVELREMIRGMSDKNE